MSHRVPEPPPPAASKFQEAVQTMLREIDPDVLCVLTTGYARNEEAEGILDLGVRELLAKPYRLEALADVLARLIAERTRRGAG